MTTVWIDTDRCRVAAAAWTARGDELHLAAFGLALELDTLSLASNGAGPHHLTAAATELWVTSSFARLAADRSDAADDRFDPGSAASVARLRTMAGATVQQSLLDACSASWAAYSFSSVFGDALETFDAEVRSPYAVVGRTGPERGRNLLMRALADTADDRQIRVDEFEVVRLDNGRYVVVLPGVTDLSRPDLGWNDGHRSVRDLDQAAFWSSRSTATADNAYARLVHEGLVELDVPVGAEIMIVGHSFGADTALDLAADPTFNGPDGYRVTHVVAAAYHSGPQLAHIPDGTEVLVLQNHRDAAVIVETIGHAHVTDAVVDRAEALADLAEVDLVGAGGNLISAAGHDMGALWAGARHVGSRLDDLGRAASGVMQTDPSLVVDGLGDFVTLEPGVRLPAPGQVVDVFRGGGEGAGHHQRNYLDHLDAVDDPAVVGFLRSVDDAGYAVPGVAFAVDVSVPGDRR